MNQNDLLKIFFIALAKILGVAIVFGAGFGIISQSWVIGIAVFAFAITSQFVINYFVESIAARKNREAEFLAKQILKEAAERQLPYDLNCAYCNTLNRVGISLSKKIHSNVLVANNSIKYIFNLLLCELQHH
jgi:hypothetical protein